MSRARHLLFTENFHEPASGQGTFDQQPVGKIRFADREKQYGQPAVKALAAENGDRLIDRFNTVTQAQRR